MTLRLHLADEAATMRLGADLAAATRAGDLFALAGDLGAGKSTLARGFLRGLHDDPALEVPSPTFTIVQVYPAGRLPAIHCDLYRIADPSELDELGLDEALEAGVALVEWPERAELHGPEIRVLLTEAPGREGREATIDASPDTEKRLSRSLAMRALLDRAGHGGARRRPMPGDASSRGYECVESRDETLLLMDSPAMTDKRPAPGSTVPYSRIAHLAEDVRPFVAVGHALHERGFAAPAIHASDLGNGILLTEHLGSDSILLADGSADPARYLAVAETLAALHDVAWPAVLPVPGAEEGHALPRFDRGVVEIEIDMTLDWAFPRLLGRYPSPDERASFRAAWEKPLAVLERAETSLMLRDIQYPNIIWRGERAGTDRVGLIDFQDALLGPAAYDVASLGQDARVIIPADLEAEIKARYLASRNTVDPNFEAAYTVCAAQRATRLFGLWVRLDERDGKSHYLAHMPRTRTYLARVLPHPIMAGVRRWFEDHDLLERAEALAEAA